MRAAAVIKHKNKNNIW